MRRFNIRIITLSLFSVLLVACGSSPSNIQGTALTPKAVELASAIPKDPFDRLVWQAEQANTQEDAISYYFAAALLKYQKGENNNALSILEDYVIPYKSQYQFDAYFLMSEVYIENSQALFALGALFEAKNLEEANILENRIQLSQQRAKALESLENWPAVVNERINLSALLPVELIDENERTLWTSIQNLTDSEIEALQQNQDVILSGWLYISSILRSKTDTLNQQRIRYDQWRTATPYHPAALNPPEDFNVLAGLDQIKLNNIGIALPMTGSLAAVSQAIIDGFLAAYYDEKNTTKPQITFINTSGFTSVDKILDVIDEKELDIIIGPLTKDLVAPLASIQLPIPIIALNQLEEPIANENLHYFSLSREDDIRELISFAKQEGATRTAILALDESWALRQVEEFKKIAKQEDIEILDSIVYKNQPSERAVAVKQLLLVSESQQRKKQIELLIDKSVESIDRSRLDLDYVYYIGRLEDAKQIRPSLDFYFANNIPMLASSTINNTVLDSKAKAKDAERILFSEVPALTKPATTLRRVEGKVSGNILKRLQAMGADAYLLANRYWIFHQLPHAKMSANTGLLTMDSKGVFRKRPELVLYKSGKLVNVKDREIFFQETESIQ